MTSAGSSVRAASAEETARLRDGLQALGFDVVRFTSASGDPSAGALDAWLEEGRHADMAWMERTREKRTRPEWVLPGARSWIMLGVNYASPAETQARFAEDASNGSDRPRWARYALHEDYHDTIRPGLVAAGKVLEAMFGASPEDYRFYVDTGPVLERSWAALSGMGFVGKNAMLISRDFGNWLFLASLLTRVEFTPDPPLWRNFDERARERARAPGLLCGKCTRCLDACPTAAFAAPGVVDARRCVSYQTIENKGVIPRELRAGIGQRVYGCDVCAEVCPWNRFAQAGRGVLLAARRELADLSLEELLALTPERFAAVFKGTAIKRVKLAGLLRNACIVAGNRGDPASLPALIALAGGHLSALVRAHAVWAVFRLGGGEALARARAAELDPQVLAEYAAEDGLTADR